jgi:arabinogalactan endo-1,4-beta-galactosidase
MKLLFFAPKSVVVMVSMLLLVQCGEPSPSKLASYKAHYQVQTGTPVNVMLTAFSTTLLANGTDVTNLRIALSDTASRQILDRTDTVQVFIFGDGRLTDEHDKPLELATDSTGAQYATCVLSRALSNLKYTTGTQPGKVKIEARCGKLWPGAHEIHTIPANVALLTPTPQQLPATTLPIDRMIGADISFLPELEHKGQKFYYNHIEVDALNLLQQHGINYIRLRLFVNPKIPRVFTRKRVLQFAQHTGVC